MDPYQLPIYRYKSRIVDAVKQHPVIVIESPTGSGKTTQLPLILRDAGLATHLIGVTQPRRIAAVTVSSFMARQLQSTPGEIVSYKVRFQDNETPSQEIKVMTDGILLQELKADPLLSRYSILIVDEVHERSLNIDFTLGILKNLLTQRKDFKVILSSATLNTDVFATYFHHCPLISLDAPTFDVLVSYDPAAELALKKIKKSRQREKNARESLLAKIVGETLEKAFIREPQGDALVFLSGEREILLTLKHLRSLFPQHLILPLYGRLSKEEQEKAFLPAPRKQRKIVVATNIAETSITIDNISVVVDSGLAKYNYFDPRTHTQSLIEQYISQASATQRKGRAGRTRPGVCYRLYSHKSLLARPAFTQEEIFRTDLSEVVLRMAEMGIHQPQDFPFLSPPESHQLQQAIDNLQQLEALTSDNRLTEIGQMMSWFPLLPQHSRCLVEGILYQTDVLEELCKVISFLSSSSPFLRPLDQELQASQAHQSFHEEKGDFFSYLSLLQHYQGASAKEELCRKFFLDYTSMQELVNVSTQLMDILQEKQIPIGNKHQPKELLYALGKGLYRFICIRVPQKNRCISFAV